MILNKRDATFLQLFLFILIFLGPAMLCAAASPEGARRSSAKNALCRNYFEAQDVFKTMYADEVVDFDILVEKYVKVLSKTDSDSNNAKLKIEEAYKILEQRLVERGQDVFLPALRRILLLKIKEKFQELEFSSSDKHIALEKNRSLQQQKADQKSLQLILKKYGVETLEEAFLYSCGKKASSDWIEDVSLNEIQLLVEAGIGKNKELLYEGLSSLLELRNVTTNQYREIEYLLREIEYLLDIILRHNLSSEQLSHLAFKVTQTGWDHHLQKILEAGIDVNKFSEKGEALLVTAVLKESLPCVELLIAASPTLGRPTLVASLLEAGASSHLSPEKLH